MKKKLTQLSSHIKLKRKQYKLTQPELAVKSGVGLRFIRDLEQGKKTLRMDKVNDVLKLFGEVLGPVPLDREKLLNEDI
jgi:y4mF family transcriptional regulator